MITELRAAQQGYYTNSKSQVSNSCRNNKNLINNQNVWRQIKVEIQKQQTPVLLTDWSFFLAALANSDKSRLLYVK